MKELRIIHGVNYYEQNIQGKANEPITVAGLLDRARYALGFRDVEYSLEAIYDRLEHNAPRVAIIGGSLDHPAHVVDWETVLKAAYSIWKHGGVPFFFAIPVVCDGTAQSNVGMCYSLQSRNEVAAMVVNQMEGQSYHGAFVIQGCDKTPTGILSGLCALDRTRQRRGDAPVFATFAPAHVLRGGTIPDDLREEILGVAQKAEGAGKPQFAEEIRDTLRYTLQCTSDQAFQGIFKRLVREGVISEAYRKHLEKYLCIHTCDAKGGICAFNGTGNSSRHVMSAFGMVHPAVELLTEPPSQEAIDAAVRSLLSVCNDPRFSVSNIVRANIENAVRVHSATGGSTNLVMHLVAVMRYAGVDFTLWDYDRIRRAVPVPELIDYSIPEGRDIFTLAQQCCSGQVRGMETVIYELSQLGVPMQLEAPTVTGQTWRERLSDPRGLVPENVPNAVILPRPKRPYSGIEVLTGNFFESAVVKISGMKDSQIAEFDDKLYLALYYENEDAATEALLNPRLLEDLCAERVYPREHLLTLHRYNRAEGQTESAEAQELDYEALFERMVQERTLKLMLFISGQGPVAFGMPEMFTPTEHLNRNYRLNPLVVLVSDGRYSGASYGAAIGHMAPEAARGGGILYLQTGDAFRLYLRRRRIELLDGVALARGEVVPYEGDLAAERKGLGEERLARIAERRALYVCPTNQMLDVTDASKGVIPLAVDAVAGEPYSGEA
ncbi:MAG: dihydroxy-acid dehydratase [Candidatus Poribacteria bacterium]|nr:MAG: dihydroxy-acid dehydratase [Candidatus Poribacteria bacterium]